MSAAKGSSKGRKARASRKQSSARTKKTQSRGGNSASEPDLVVKWFRLLARRRGAWLQHLWLRDGSIEGLGRSSHAELAGILNGDDSLEAELEWARSDESVHAWIDEAEEVKRQLDDFPGSRFSRLAEIFALGSEEKELLQLSAAVEFEPKLKFVCAYMQEHAGKTYLTEDLAGRLLGRDLSSVGLPELNLFRWNLVQRREAYAESSTLVCDPQVQHWLRGRSSLNESLVGVAELVVTPRFVIPEWRVEEIVQWASVRLNSKNSPMRIIVSAPNFAGKRQFAAAVAVQLGIPLLIVDTDHIEDQEWPRVFQRAQRQAFLDPTALAWTGEMATRRPWPVQQAIFPLQFVLCEPGMEPPTVPNLIDRVVSLPMPEAPTREKLWRGASPAAEKWKSGEIKKLSEQHSLWPREIERIVQLGGDNPSRASTIARENARTRFGHLAEVLDSSFTPADLVLPEGVKELLSAITFEAEERTSFWQGEERRRLFPQGRGVVVLFTGPSGTGKTMAAQVIAGQLTRDLLRINIAQLVSKWVGETSKNIEQIMRAAIENDVVLFFDEADALFARRSTEIRDAQDRFANTDTAFLLQAIEAYPGIAILSSNLKANIDAAFLRRLRYLVEFPKPDASLRQVLWTRFITSLSSDEDAKSLVHPIELLATNVEATGAQIKFAVLGAMFSARASGRVVAAKDLLIGIDRELAKEGRAIGSAERAAIIEAG